MAQPTYDQVAQWITQQTADVSKIQYGKNDVSGNEKQADLSASHTAIVEYESTVRAVTDKTEDAEKKAQLEQSYNNLKSLSAKKVAGAQTIVGVTSLETSISRLSRELDSATLNKTRECQKNVQLQQEKPADVENLTGFIASVAQDSIFGLRDNWQWIVQFVKCVDIHLRNGADYHQFFHEIEHTEPWLIQDMSELSKCLSTHDISSDEDEAKKLIDELLKVTVTLRQWEARVNRIWETAVRLRPLPLRVDGIQQPTPSTALVDYQTSEISVREGEDILLLENSNPRFWKVRNGRGQEADVPAVIVLIPGPDAAVIEAAVRLRLELLAAWTNAVKHIGGRIIHYLLMVFKPDYNTEEISSLTTVRDVDKRNLLHLLSFIEETLQKHWADHDGFIGLQERILALRFILEEIGEGENKDDNLYQKLLVQITTLAHIIELYQSMFGDWEKYKVATEASRQPELMLIVDKWQQLQFVSREYFAKFWKSKLPFGEQDSLAGLRQFTLDDVQVEDTVQTETSKATLFSMQSTETTDGGEVVFIVPDIVDSSTTENGSTETSSVFTTTFTTTNLSSSKNGKDGDGTFEEGFDESGHRTVVTVNVGDFTDGKGGGRREIRRAQVNQLGTASSGEGEVGSAEEGFDEIRETTYRTSVGSEQEGTDFGMATERKTAETEQLMAAEVEEKKTFTIKSVINPEDGKEIPMQQAIALGILRPNEGMYVNPTTGESKPIPVAMNEGLIKVMFTTTKRSQEKTSSVGIITVKTVRESVRPYVVVSAVDTRSGADLSPADATKAGILDESRGTYIDKKTGRRYLIAEASESGLVKIEYTGPAPEPEVISKTYAVRAVVDRRAKKTITFHEAVRRGIIDRESGAYRDTMTGDKMYVGDAIMRGFLKARIIDDASGLNIDPENRMVIDKTEKIRKRLLKPLGVISAFKMAAAAAAATPSSAESK